MNYLDELRTRRLTLRPAAAGDAFDIYTLLNADDIRPLLWNGAGVSMQSVNRLLSESLRTFALGGFGLWIIHSGDKHRLLGFAGLRIEFRTRLPEITFAIAGEFRERGFATEAVRAVVDYARQTLSLAGLFASVRPGNQASARTLLRCGFFPSGIEWTDHGELLTFNCDPSDKAARSRFGPHAGAPACLNSPIFSST